MAAVVPATKGTAGWVAPGYMYLSDAGVTPDTLTNRRPVPFAGLRHERWYFADLDNTELWTTPPAGMVALGVQIGSNVATIAAVSMNASRQMLVSTASNSAGYVHTWSRGGKVRGTGTNVPPVSKGTSGYVRPGRTMLITDQDNGGSDPLTTGRYAATSDGALDHVVLFFTGVDASANDTWTPTARVVPRIVDYCWQGVEIGDDVQLTFSTTAMTFWGAADARGWLHLWLR